MNTTRHIAIVGGGFAGTTLARALERQMPPGWQLVLISEESYTTFNPMLAEVVGASVFPEHVVAPIRQMLSKSRFVMGRVASVDLARKVVQANTLAGVQDIAFDHLVLAFGTRARLDLVPGLAEHALPLKLVGDALHIRNRVLQRVARIELETDPQVRQQLGRFVVIGGGFSGVEVAGAIADFLKSLCRWYPRVAASELQVTLLHDQPRLLPELPESLGLAAAKSMGQRGIDVRLGARAVQVQADGVRLANGDFIDSATVVCTIGTQANPLAQKLGLPSTRGRLDAEADMSVRGAPGVWALGDCAAVRNQADGALAPPTAQFAVAQAQLLAKNILAHIAGRPTEAFAHQSKGAMATTGHLKGVAHLGLGGGGARGIRLAGLPAWLLWRAYYLQRMPTWGRKLRIWVEWTWGMFFPADITHLRFTRTPDIDRDSELPLPVPFLTTSPTPTR